MSNGEQWDDEESQDDWIDWLIKFFDDQIKKEGEK